MKYRCEVESEELLSYTYQCQTQNTSSFRDVKFKMKNHLIFALQKTIEYAQTSSFRQNRQ